MIVVDVNLLIYAVNEDSPDHHKARSWLEATVSGTETVGLPWIVLLAFLRLTTRPGLSLERLNFDLSDLGTDYRLQNINELSFRSRGCSCALGWDLRGRAC